MANSIIKGLALTFGGGIALGVGIKIGQSAAASRVPETEGTEDLVLEPVLDRLESVEGRIVQVETALAHPPAAPDVVMPEVGILHQQIVTHDHELENLRNDIRTIDERSSQTLEEIGKTVGALESKLPSMIEATATPRISQMEERLRTEIEENQARAIETLVDNLQTKVVQRISALENDFSGQSEAINQLRDYSLKTDLNMQRLISGVDRLAAEISKRSEVPAPPPAPPPAPSSEARSTPPPMNGTPATAPVSVQAAPEPMPPPAKPPTPEKPASDYYVPKTFESVGKEVKKKFRFKWLAPAIGAGLLVPVGIIGWQFAGTPQIKPSESTVQAASQPATDDAAKMEAAKTYDRNKDYAKAEQLYRGLLKDKPQDRDVVNGLAHVLFKQEKYDDAAAVLATLPTGDK
jgi:TolA-binding protein